MRIAWLLVASFFLATPALAHNAPLDAYGCHANKQALGSPNKRECHVGLLTGNVYDSLDDELTAYIAAQKLQIDDLTVKLEKCEAACPVTPPQPTTGNLMLNWNANPEPDLAGYKVYCGTAPHTYGTAKAVGNVTTTTISNLPVGNTYYCGVTAVDTANNESPMSAEVSKILP